MAKKRLFLSIAGSVPVCLLGLFLSGCNRDSALPVSTAPPAVSGSSAFELDYDQLAGPLGALSEADRDAVSDTIQLIKKSEHTLALVRLSSLNQSNPQNSSLRILASYALLQAGNLLEAFEEAEKAHAAPNRDSYKCWFLAKVALLNGDKAVSERELRHVQGAGEMVAEARQLEKEIGEKFGLEPATP